MDYFPVQPYRAATMECVLQAAVRRNVPANVLLAIGQHEAGKEGSQILNKNGSYDLGRAGINTTHLKELANYGVKPEVATYYLKFDGCYNYEMAAFLLQRHLYQCQSDFWTCVGNYHSKSRDPSKNAKNLAYQAKIRPLASAWSKYLAAHYTIKDYTR